MTTGNVTQAGFMPGVVATSAIPPVGSTGKDFQNIINNLGTTNKPVNEPIGETTEIRTNGGKVRDAVKNNSVNDKKNEDVDVSKLADDIKEVVKDTLDITDEELEEAMATLGITIADLLNPQNVVALIAEINDTSAVAIVTDDKLSNLLATLNNEIASLVDEFSQANNISFEEITESLEKFVNNDETENAIADDEVPEAVVEFSKDDSKEVVKNVKSDDTKTVEVTIEKNGNTVTSETATVTNKENDGKSKDSKNDSNDNASQNILNNISNALTDAIDNVTGTENVNQVNGVDIINQIMDAVKVNVTEEIQTMEINLNPENLGKLNLTVAAKDGIITATITAQNEAVKSAIENQITMLKEQFESQGLKVEDVEVTVASHGFDANMDNNSNDADNNTKSNARRRFRGIDEIEDDSTADVADDLIDSNISLKA